jgi:hypothetical protein
MLEFPDAIEKRSKPGAGIEQGHISSASCIPANLSQQLGRSLTGDPEQGCIVNDAEANQLLLRPDREPWLHPALA